MCIKCYVVSAVTWCLMISSSKEHMTNCPSKHWWKGDGAWFIAVRWLCLCLWLVCVVSKILICTLCAINNLFIWSPYVNPKHLDIWLVQLLCWFYSKPSFSLSNLLPSPNNPLIILPYNNNSCFIHCSINLYSFQRERNKYSPWNWCLIALMYWVWL